MAASVGDPPGAFVDLGAGGGVPGLALLLGWPSSHAVLVESQRRRCRFLDGALAELGLSERASVACERAEALARRPDLRGRFDAVVARSFGAPAVTAECAVGFLAPDGLLVVAEPPTPEDARWPEGPLAELGLTVEGRIRTGAFGFARLRRTGPLAERWPRRAPAKRPLWG